MRLATYLHEGAESFGVVTDKGICDVLRCWPDGPRGLAAALQAGPEAMKRIRELTRRCARFIPEDQVRLLAPLPRPPKLLALAGNYVEHIRESKLDKGLTADPHRDTVPRPFLMPFTAVAAPGQEIPWPCYSRTIDYEAELAVVIGSTCKCVRPSEAGGHIAGYTIANDISARSTTWSEGRAKRPWDEFYDWLNGKWADGFCPLGPCLVTADEVGDPTNLAIELSVNGKTRQKANTGRMIFNVYEIVSFISHIMTLTPGDVIATGTPSGVGAATGTFLQAGDVITARIERIGELTNVLGAAPKEHYTPCK